MVARSVSQGWSIKTTIGESDHRYTPKFVLGRHVFSVNDGRRFLSEGSMVDRIHESDSAILVEPE